MDRVYGGFSELEGMCRERQRKEEGEESDDGEGEGEAMKVKGSHWGWRCSKELCGVGEAVRVLLMLDL
jgi:hypothetical protein